MDKIELIKGDITKLNADAIVNAANSSLLGGSGVDGAIHRAAGRELYEFCKTLNGCPTGDAKISPGFGLPARYVIHTVGPRWRGGDENEPELLKSCYNKSLQLAVDNNCKSVVFPCISTGVYHFPKEEAAEIAINTISDFLKNHNDLKVSVCIFDDENYGIYSKLLKNQ